MSDMTRDLSSIIGKGGQKGAYRRISLSDDVIASAEVDWHDVQYRLGHDINLDIAEEAVYGEEGELQAQEEGNDTSSLLIKFSAFDAAFMRFVRDECGPGKYFELFMDCGKSTGGKRLEIFYAIVSFSKAYKVSFKGRKPELKVNIHNNLNSRTPEELPDWAVGVEANFIVAAGNKYEPFET